MTTSRWHVGVERTLLCATRFWSLGGERGKATTPTLLQGVRSVVRKQGHKPAEIDAAIRRLEKKGLIEVSGARTAKTIRLTTTGGKVGCATVRLSPWTDDGYPGANLSGAK